MALLPSYSKEHFEAFRSILKRFKLDEMPRPSLRIIIRGAHAEPISRRRAAVKAPCREGRASGAPLHGRHRRRDQDCGRTPLVFMRLVAALIADLVRQQLQCVGCGGQKC